MHPTLLDNRLTFPDPSHCDAEGLVAFGGDLSINRLLLAYRTGVFPWTVKPITWWSPDPRAIFDLDNFQTPRRLAQTLRRQPYEVRFDTAFADVMRGCAQPGPGREHTWITPEFIAAYTDLHKAGHAHSVECWQGDELMGGIYGVHVGGLFAGESMFHRADNASKVALVHLVERLRQRAFVLFDIQMLTPVTRALGAREIPRREYLQRLAHAVTLNCPF